MVTMTMTTALLTGGLLEGDGVHCGDSLGLSSVRLRVAQRCHRGPGGHRLLDSLVFGAAMLCVVSAARVVVFAVQSAGGVG